MKTTMVYRLIILTSIQLTNTYAMTAPSSKIDCSKYSNDEDLVHRFPFVIHLNAAITNAGMTFAAMDRNHNVTSIQIAHERCIPSLIFCFKHLSILKIVSTDFCDFRQRIPSDIERFASTLTEFHIFNLRIPHLPSELNKLKHLHTLRLSNTDLASLPNWIGDLVSLKFLLLNENNLSRLPRTLTNLQSLQHLTLNDNLNLRSIQSLNGHRSLQFLDTRHCPIRRLPQNLPQLIALYMINNRLKDLDGIESLGYATYSAKMFNFDGNRIQTISSGLSFVRNLTELHLGWNLLKVLPSDIFNIPTLTQLDIKGNRFSDRDRTMYISNFSTTNPNLRLTHD